MLVLAYVFLGGPAALLLFALITKETPLSQSLALLSVSAMLLFIVGGLTYWWLRQRRYGESVCKLITLPGVIGGWLKADIDCRLPRESSGPVIVRLKNLTWHGKSSKLHWEMEQRLAPGTIQEQPGGRATVRVRLKIPRHPDQVPCRPTSFWDSPTHWTLEISRETKGVDFLTSFSVPVFDTTEAPPDEQRSE